MHNTTLTADEKRCLQMWFRQAIVEVEKQEALQNIIAFYDGADSKPREAHHTPLFHTARRNRSTRVKELV